MVVDPSAENYARMQQHGLQMSQILSVPQNPKQKHEYYFRIGVHDLTGDRVGAIEVPVTAVHDLAAATSAKPLGVMPPAFFDPRRKSLLRGFVLVLGSLFAAFRLGDFPHNRATLLLLIPAVLACFGTWDTIRCMQRNWSFYSRRCHPLCLHGHHGPGHDPLSSSLSLHALEYLRADRC